MSAPNVNPTPKGGLTAWQSIAAPLLAPAPVLLFFIVLRALFPDLPLFFPFIGAIMPLVVFFFPFKRLYGPVGWPSFIKFIAVIDLIAVAAMLATAALLAIAGWTESGWPETILGYGAPFLIVWRASGRIYRIMFQPADD